MPTHVLLPRRLAAFAVPFAFVLALALPHGAGAAEVGGAQAPTTTNYVAQLKANGRAVPPADAPPRVQRVIRAGNELIGEPYRWGGGHLDWESRGYDCSGAVSYALHAGGLLRRPLVSGELMTWGRRGMGDWITVYTHTTHVYAVIAGLSFESAKPGSGPQWSKSMRSATGFVKRHPKTL